MEVLAAGRRRALPLITSSRAHKPSASKGAIYKCAHDLICLFGASGDAL